MSHSKCKEGYWTFGDVRALVSIVKGNEMAVKNIISLDYPDIPASWVMTMEYGDFGEAKKEVAEATGVKTYNLKLKSTMFALKAVVNDEGTELTLWGFANKMEVWEWITPEMVKKMSEDRDDAEAPR